MPKIFLISVVKQQPEKSEQYAIYLIAANESLDYKTKRCSVSNH